MAGVYCPSCEAGVEPASKFCLSCGNDLTVRGPITATGHDLNQLKDVIRTRDDLSMAEKFDMIAKVEEGANPILLGIAAPADDDEVDIGEAFAAGESENIVESAFANYQFGESATASAAVRATVRGTDGWVLVQKGDLNLSDGLFRDAMNLGMEASTHIHDVSSGEHEGIDPEAMRSIPVLKPLSALSAQSVGQTYMPTQCSNGESGETRLVMLYQCNLKRAWKQRLSRSHHIT